MRTTLAEVPTFLRDLTEGNKPQVKKADVSISANPNGNSRYGLAALKQEAATLAGTSVGRRNHQLNASAFSLGQLVAGCELNRAGVESTLFNAAQQAGLLDKEIEKTLASGLSAGMLEPRQAPIQPAPSEEIQDTVVTEQSTGGNDPWKVYTLADAYKDRPPVEYIVSGLLEIPSLSILYSPPGAFKSLLLADLVISVAGGYAWLPPAPWKDGAQPFITLQSRSCARKISLPIEALSVAFSQGFGIE